MTMDPSLYTRRIIPASPKSFKSIIAEQRAAITEAFDTQARDAVEGIHQRVDVARHSKGE
jgi:hypothetical protein